MLANQQAVAAAAVLGSSSSRSTTIATAGPGQMRSRETRASLPGASQPDPAQHRLRSAPHAPGRA